MPVVKLGDSVPLIRSDEEDYESRNQQANTLDDVS